jgi:uncharacterized protein YndB with AHSA1/START domain
VTEWPCRLDRIITINATRETVFRFFTDSVRWASWWGAGSTIDARPGGSVRIVYPGGVEVSGEVLELASPERIVFSYGYVSGQMVPPGGSRVTIRLDAEPEGTRLHLVHEFAEAAARDHHVQGWRYQLALFSNVVTNEAYAGAAGIVDGWFGAWALDDEREREAALARLVDPGVRYRDRFSVIDGLADLLPHIGASQRFMPGVRLQRKGAIRHCQGTVLADWAAAGPDGRERMTGTNVFVLGLDGRIASAIGFANG